MDGEHREDSAASSPLGRDAPATRRFAANYGTAEQRGSSARAASAGRRLGYRSTSVPISSSRNVVYRRNPRQLTVGQQSAKLAEQAKRNFFHGSFNSSHGAIFTFPNRAQQMATTRATRVPSAAASRDTSMTFRESSTGRRVPGYASPLPFAGPPAHLVSALKKAAPSSPPPGEDDLLRMFEEPIVLKRRAYSADTTRMAAGNASLNTSFVGTDQASPKKLKDSAADILAVQTMRDNSASRRSKVQLSPTTLARAARALRAFEERKVRMPDSSTSDLTIGGQSLALPTQSPLLLATSLNASFDKAADQRRVRISSIVQPLISDASEESAEDVTESSDANDDGISYGSALLDLAYLAAPAAVSMCFTFSTSVIPLAFVGSYLGEVELTGASVGFFIVSIVILYPMIGLTFAMDTLCSHEYGRDPLSPEMGLVLQRGVLINLFMLLPLFVGLLLLNNLLDAVYGPEVANVAREFLTYVPLYLIPDMLLIALGKFLTNQMQPQIPLIGLTAGVMIIPFLQMKLTPMGVRYTMVGMAITAWFQVAVVVILTLFKPETRMTLGTWRPREALNWMDGKEYMKLAIPSAIFVAAEASSFDLTVLLCAKFGAADGAAWSAIMNCLFIFASFSGGLSASACANIGRCIGADQPNSAKRYVLLSIAIAFIIGVVDSIVLVAGFDYMLSLFGTTGASLQLAREVLVLLPFFHISDAVQFTFQGIFSGLGKNHLGAVILLTCLWGIGIPLSLLFGQYLGYRTFGVCFGITIGLCIESPVMVMAASTMDYHAICDNFFEEEEDEEEEDEEDEESEYDEEYVEEVMRRSGISTFREEYAEQYTKLLPPRRRRRGRSTNV